MREIQKPIFNGIQTNYLSVGTGPTKTLAMLASRLAKKSARAAGVLDLYAYPQVEEALRRTAVEDVWGVGPQYSKLLRTNGIENALQLRDAEDKWIRIQMTVMGLRMVHELRGIPCIPMELAPQAKKGLCVSRSFGRPIETFEEMEEAVSTYAARAAAKVRKEHRAAAGMTVFLGTNPFKPDEPQYSSSYFFELPNPSQSSLELIERGLFALLCPIFMSYPRIHSMRNPFHFWFDSVPRMGPEPISFVHGT